MNNKPEILYIDDEPDNLFLFESIFGSKYNLYTTNSGPSGLSVLRENQSIQIVFSDMKMPDMDGLEFINAARERFPNIVYFILTGFDITQEMRAAILKGIVKKYIQKPFDFNEIEDAIAEAI